MDDVIESLEQASLSLLKSFKHNLLKSNAEKCHLLVSTDQEVNLKSLQFHHEKTVNLKNL